MDLTPLLSRQRIFPRLGYSGVRTGWREGLGRRAACSLHAKVTTSMLLCVGVLIWHAAFWGTTAHPAVADLCTQTVFLLQQMQKERENNGKDAVLQLGCIYSRRHLQFSRRNSVGAIHCNSVGATYGLHFRKILFLFQVFKPEMHCAFLQHSLPHHVCMQTLFLHTLYIGFAQHSPAQELALFFACEIPSLQPFLCRILFNPWDHFNNGSLPVSLWYLRWCSSSTRIHRNGPCLMNWRPKPPQRWLLFLPFLSLIFRNSLVLFSSISLFSPSYLYQSTPY